MISLIVHFTIKPGTEARAKELIRIMEEHTRKEPGCHAYVGLQSMDNANEFCFYELYDDQAALDAHSHSEHFRKYVTNGLNELIEKKSRELYSIVNP